MFPLFKSQPLLWVQMFVCTSKGEQRDRHLSRWANARAGSPQGIIDRAIGNLQASLTFPSVLERLNLKAFDLCKVIETFVRHEPLLPRELKRHLFNIEEKMLESLVWERGSSLYPKLISTTTDTPGIPLPSSEVLKRQKTLLSIKLSCGHPFPNK